ncbi:Fc.00g026390.m01.CDS01 [Cosmosporella sp. VM-42]
MVVPIGAEKVARPISIAVGDHDMMNPIAKIEQVRQVLDAKKEKGQVDTEIVIYAGAGHGFGTRSDLADKALAKHYEDAATQALLWFAKHV